MIKTAIVGYGKNPSKMIESYMDRLEHYLPVYYPNISWQFYEAKFKEATTIRCKHELKEKVLVYHPNIVFIELNSEEMDSDHPGFVSLAEYENQLEDILKEIKQFNNRTGLNKSMPIPIIITPVPINEEKVKTNRTNNRIKQYTYVAKTISAKYQCPIIDLFNALSRVEAYETFYLEENGLRLNQKGEDLLYDMLFIELTRLINYQGVLKDR
ncbi:MAG: hypothetical protein RR582_11755 [Niameybacter sp.]